MTGENQFNDFQQKAFGLCQAIYRLTDLFPKNDVLGKQIKEIAAVVTADVLTIERIGKKLPLSLTASSVKNLFDELTLSIARNADKMISYLQIAKAQNLAAPVNFDILIREYEKIISFLQSRQAPMAPPAYSPAEEFPPVSVRPPAGGSSYLPERPTVRPAPPAYKKPKPTKPSSHKYDNLNARQKRILDFLKKNREAKMADFLGVFKNEVTERTLRNDLRGLTEQRLIRAEGEFKTRRYYII